MFLSAFCGVFYHYFPFFRLLSLLFDFLREKMPIVFVWKGKDVSLHPHSGGEGNHAITNTHKRKEETMMKQNDENVSMMETAQKVRQIVEAERERARAALEQMDEVLSALDDANALRAENELLKTELRAKDAQLLEEKEQRERVEMQLREMSMLSASVAGKASQDELLKALRVFVNKSKRKKLEKRIAVKEMVLELAVANSVVFPEDLAAAIGALDDEQPETKVVNVTGNYNDIHDNGSVVRA